MREQILNLLNEILPQIDFAASDKLVTDGILDSLSIVTIVSELSVEFGVEFDIDQLAPENLDSVDAMVETVQFLQSKA